MVIESVLSTVLGVELSESVAWTVKVNPPAVVGVPVISPVDAPSTRPGGSDPTEMEKLTGETPPQSCINPE